MCHSVLARVGHIAGLGESSVSMVMACGGKPKRVHSRCRMQCASLMQPRSSFALPLSPLTCLAQSRKGMQACAYNPAHAYAYMHIPIYAHARTCTRTQARTAFARGTRTHTRTRTCARQQHTAYTSLDEWGYCSGLDVPDCLRSDSQLSLVIVRPSYRG